MEPGSTSPATAGHDVHAGPVHAGPVHAGPVPDVARADVARADLVHAGLVAGVLAVLGALLGLVWSWWSPAGPAAQVLGHGEFIVDETETFVAGDGRYLVIVAAVGLVAAVLAWRDKAHRGPIVVWGLVIGGLAGSLLMELVGHLTGGGTFTGSSFPNVSGKYTLHMPLSLHVQGLLLVESVVAALLYGLLAAFAADDDLGRPDPVRDRLARAQEPVSVGAGDHAQDGWRDGDAPGPLQQGDLPPQQPPEPY